MSISGKAAMGLLGIYSRIRPIAVPDPEKFLADSREYNARHPFRRLKDHKALYRYYRMYDYPCIRIRPRKKYAAGVAAPVRDRAILYLHGGIRNDWEMELMVARGYANHTGMDVWYPVYPSVTDVTADKIIHDIFRTYRKIAQQYGAENMAVIGTSFGGTFGFGMIDHMNLLSGEGNEAPAGQPAVYIANSPGGVPDTEADWAEMERLTRYDPLIDLSAVRNILPVQRLLAEDPSPAGMASVRRANSPAYGDFRQVPETYVYYAEETLAGNHLAYERAYEKYGVGEKLHMHIRPGMMHGYSCLPVFPESREAYREQIAVLRTFAMA